MELFKFLITEAFFEMRMKMMLEGCLESLAELSLTEKFKF
jgi:hypothetical protein